MFISWCFFLFFFCFPHTPAALHVADTAYVHGSAAACAGYSYERYHQTAKEPKLNGRSIDLTITRHCSSNSAAPVKAALDAERDAARDGTTDKHVTAIIASRYHRRPHPRVFKADTALHRRLDVVPLDDELAAEWPVTLPAQSKTYPRLTHDDADALGDSMSAFDHPDYQDLQPSPLSPMRSFATVEVHRASPCLPCRNPCTCLRVCTWFERAMLAPRDCLSPLRGGSNVGTPTL